EQPMRDDHARRIAEIEAGLEQPLPAITRQLLEQELEQLRARVAPASPTSPHGTTNVSGTLHGNAVGVNYGTVQTYLGASPAPGDQPSAGVSQEEIDDQRALLAAHRRTLAIYLKQQAQLGSAYAPPGVEHGIREARDAIRRIKAVVRGWGLAVDDH